MEKDKPKKEIKEEPPTEAQLEYRRALERVGWHIHLYGADAFFPWTMLYENRLPGEERK